jgi:hypothetical protein
LVGCRWSYVSSELLEFLLTIFGSLAFFLVLFFFAALVCGFSFQPRSEFRSALDIWSDAVDVRLVPTFDDVDGVFLVS